MKKVIKALKTIVNISINDIAKEKHYGFKVDFGEEVYKIARVYVDKQNFYTAICLNKPGFAYGYVSYKNLEDFVNFVIDKDLEVFEFDSLVELCNYFEIK